MAEQEKRKASEILDHPPEGYELRKVRIEEAPADRLLAAVRSTEADPTNGKEIDLAVQELQERVRELGGDPTQPFRVDNDAYTLEYLAVKAQGAV